MCPMRVLAEVVGRPLNLRGAIYAVGERLRLETRNEQHREVLANQWVRRIDPPNTLDVPSSPDGSLDSGRARPVSAGPPASPAPVVVAAALSSAPVDRMVKAPIAAKGKRR